MLAALEQAGVARPETAGLIHHKDQSAQYLSIRLPERLKEADLESSVGSRGDAYENVLAESPNGL